MITVSQEFQEALENGVRNYLVKVDITLSDSTVLSTITKDNLIELSIEDAVSQDNKFTALGGSVINKATITIDNSSENYSIYDFNGAIVTIKIGLQISDSPEYIDRGIYIVDSVSPKGVGIELSCLDYMSKFDKSFTETTVVYPATIKSIIDDACLTCGVIFTGAYPDSDYTLTIMPMVSTFRELLSAVGQITGTYAHVDRQGRLYFSWFNTTLLNQAIDSDTKVSGVYYIEDVLDNNYEKDNITVNGIRAYVINDESNEKFEHHYPATLTDNDFCLNITGNPLISGGNITEIINRVGPRVVELTIRQTKCKHTNNPLVEAGDVAMVLYSVKNNTNAYYPIAITRTTFAINQAQETVCGIETLAENLDGRYNDAQLLREQTKKDTNDARRVATNYLSADTTGIMIADLADGVQTPSTATGRNVKIDNSAVYIRDGQTVYAQFGDVVRLGKIGSSYQLLDYHSLKLIAKEGDTYLHISDLRDSEGYATLSEIHTYYSVVNYIKLNFNISSVTSVIVNETTELELDVDYTFNNSGVYGYIAFQNTELHPVSGDSVNVIYKTTDRKLKAFSFGSRDTGNLGALSFTGGRELIASGLFSCAFGNKTSAKGRESFAEGYGSIASGDESHAEGNNTIASGSQSHAEGDNTQATKDRAHAEGGYTIASGSFSHAEGERTTASNGRAHAEGSNTVASGVCSHAEGYLSNALGRFSHAQNLGTIASSRAQTVIGRYNIEDPVSDPDYTSTYAFIIGNGTAEDARSNAFTVDWNGNVNIPSGASYQIDGVSFDNNYVKKSGDTMTGTLALPFLRFNTDVDTSLDLTRSTQTYFGQEHVYDGNSRNIFYSEMSLATDRLYRSYVVRGYDSQGTELGRNGFYLTVYNNGTPGVSFTSNAVRDAWRKGLGMGYHWSLNSNLGQKTGTGTALTSIYESNTITIPAGTYIIGITVPIYTSKYTSAFYLRIGTTTLCQGSTNQTEVNNRITLYDIVTLSSAITGKINIVCAGQDSTTVWTVPGYNRTSYFIYKIE